MKKLMVICILLSGLILSSSSFAVTVTEEWAAMYDGQGNDIDVGWTMVVDDAGDIYVTGWSVGSDTLNEDYATVKYDADGTELWTARYNGPGNGRDRARAMVVDDKGDVYVAGSSVGVGTGRDYAIVKYDNDGNVLWVQRYNGTGNGRDEAWAMVVDNSGDLYVTGWSVGIGTNSDYTTVKYDADGNQLWVARYNNDVGNDNDHARAIAVDGGGNVYVTGQSMGIGTWFDYATVKYDADGAELWSARYDGPGKSFDYALALAVDNAGDVYITGGSAGSGTPFNYFDYATIKYDADGTRLWVERYNGLGNDADTARILAIDAKGDIYVTGRSVGSGTSLDYVTVKYDDDGNRLWVARYNGTGGGSDIARAMVIDAKGNIYVSGESVGSGASSDYATVKYDADGAELWTARYNGPGNGSDVAWDMAVDDKDNVYVTGESVASGTGSNYATVKYAAD